MKFRGETVEPETCIVEIPKSGQIITFIFKTVLNMKGFTDPFPEAPTMFRQGKKVQNQDDPLYKDRVEKWVERRTAWMFLKSCEDSPDIEWETVNIEDPSTYLNLYTELESTFNIIEQAKIMEAFTEVNSLTESKLEKARESFLDQEMSLQDAVSISQSVEVNNTPSGSPVND